MDSSRQMWRILGMVSTAMMSAGAVYGTIRTKVKPAGVDMKEVKDWKSRLDQQVGQLSRLPDPLDRMEKGIKQDLAGVKSVLRRQPLAARPTHLQVVLQSRNSRLFHGLFLQSLVGGFANRRLR